MDLNRQRAKGDEGAAVVSTIIALSPLSLFLAFLGYCAVALILSLATLWVLHLRWKVDARTLPVAPFFTAVTTVWALSVSFAAADLWTVRAQAEQAAIAEGSSLARLHGMAAADALDSPDLIDALSAYVTSVARSEWGDNANAAPSSDVDGALQRMRLAIIALAERGTPAPLIGKMAQDFDEMQDARNLRLAIGVSSISEYKWYLVLILTVLSMIAIAAVHADRPPAGVSALVIFAFAAIASLWILALYANPYTGGARVTFHAPVLTDR